MKPYKKLLSVLLVLAVAFSVILPSAPAAASDPRTIKILFTHDMHSSLLPGQVADSNGNLTEAGGFARLSAAIQGERSAGQDGTLLVDAGDYSMGTVFQTLETTAAPELRLMGGMGYDAVTAGNHEFDYTGRVFAKSLEAAKQSGDALPAYVMSNMTIPDNSAGADALREAMLDYGVKDYTVVEKNGVKIGIFGLLGKDAAADAATSKPAVFGDIVQASKRVVDILKNQQKADLIVCLSHSGTDPDVSKSEDEQLAKAVPDIDVIISGHTHTVLQQPIIVGHTVIASCGANSAYLGVLDLTYGQGWKVQDYSLKAIDSSVKDDPDVAAKVDGFKTLVDKYLEPYGYNYDQVSLPRRTSSTT